ncbi:MAG TPA: ABC transporter ATP-binding protein [Jiangellaceae bacterium]|nr:ABC transporter ATP-binding protein [Jiangellaceae bacterium]
MSALVIAENISRTFLRGTSPVHALRGVSLELNAGELVALVGRSGSGKTTLLNVIGGIDGPDDGEVVINGRMLSRLGEAGRQRLRREQVGFVFQSFGLLPFLSARENVGVPLRMLRWRTRAREARVVELLATVGLSDHAEHRPAELSGGQQQRVAIARALAPSPHVLLADEPTGQLDSETGGQVVALLQRLVHESSSAALVATHDPALVSYADRVLYLRDGELVSSYVASRASQGEER